MQGEGGGGGDGGGGGGGGGWGVGADTYCFQKPLPSTSCINKSIIDFIIGLSLHLVLLPLLILQSECPQFKDVQQFSSFLELAFDPRGLCIICLRVNLLHDWLHKQAS